MKMPSDAAVELAKAVLDRYNAGDQGVDAAPGDRQAAIADAKARAVAAGPAIVVKGEMTPWPVLVDLAKDEADMPTPAEVSAYLAEHVAKSELKDAKPKVMSMAEAERQLAIAVDQRDKAIAAKVERNLGRKVE